MQEDAAPIELNVDVAHPARMYDYYLGGKDNFTADREAAEAALQSAPEIRSIARQNRAFVQRAVRHIVSQGIRQILDLGAGLPTQRNVHEIAQEIAPDTRVVYVDNDPIVLVHARALLTGSADGDTRVLQADVRDSAELVHREDVRDLIDFSKPMATMLVSVLQFVPDKDPEEIVAPIREVMAPGSYLVLAHPTHDFRTDEVLKVASTYGQAKAPAVPRGKAEIEGLFGDFELLEPGLVQSPLWRPDGPLPEDLDRIWMYAGVGRKR
ncbi:SAM-dependent methyltransferase [Actinomadura sp. SCN-SB]|uniref:SAM-dependent methyltransferase n=1 Tax=Actinomadura sp. SCN-SB TaxID=3373092 RepID=UPI0037539023